MLIFSKGKALKNIEEGLQWQAGELCQMPMYARTSPDGVIVNVPALNGQEQLVGFARALAAESEHMLGDAQPHWVQLTGAGVGMLPIDGMRAILQAASPATRSAGIDIGTAALEPGVIAGYRSIAVERFNYRVDGPFLGIEEPVRRARSLGAFASVEVCFGGELAGRAFLQAVERAVAASPNQISLRDERVRGAFGAEFLERAGEMCAVAGFRRVSLWTWTQGDACFDTFGMRLSGRCAMLGPDAVCARPVAYANPGLPRWLETRLNGDFETVRAQGRLEQWMALAAGLYWMELRRDRLEGRVHRQASGLERIGIVDRQGRPAGGASLEFCHRAARAAGLMLAGGSGLPAAEAALPRRIAVTTRRRG